MSLFDTIVMVDWSASATLDRLRAATRPVAGTETVPLSRAGGRILAAGAVEVFASEGPGRISGLAWAQGLVELGDGPRTIRPDDPVRYLAFADFGL